MVNIPSIQDSEQLYAVSTILPFVNMQELDLSGLQLSGDQWCALLESVSRCTGLRVLSIKGCALGTLGTCRITGSNESSRVAAQQLVWSEVSWGMHCVGCRHVLTHAGVLQVLRQRSRWRGSLAAAA